MDKKLVALFMAAGVLIGAASVAPVGAHVGGSVGHLWKKHIRPRATKLFYTKKQSNQRYMQFGGMIPPGKTVRGSWALGGAVNAPGEDGNWVEGHISFGGEMSAPPIAKLISSTGVTPPGCTGTRSNPGAEPGNLCIWTALGYNTQVPGNLTDAFYIDEFEGKTGRHIYAYSAAAGGIELFGTWAATAPLAGMARVTSTQAGRPPSSR